MQLKRTADTLRFIAFVVVKSLKFYKLSALFAGRLLRVGGKGKMTKFAGVCILFALAVVARSADDPTEKLPGVTDLGETIQASFFF
jgi:hypothetical protein